MTAIAAATARRLIVTRPADEATQWVAKLAARGFDAAALPLIEIAPALDLQALRAAQVRLDRYHAVFFVSGNAVSHFFEQKAASSLVVTSFIATKTRAWAPGPGTAGALMAAGVPEERVDSPAAHAAQFDSEALWSVVQQQIAPGGRVLIVRGSDDGATPAGRDWLARQLDGAGIQVDQVAAYRRSAPAWTDAERALARSALTSTNAIWLFSSSQAIANLQALLPRTICGDAGAIATHPRIARSARAAGFGVVYESRPSLDAVCASIKSFG
ncbi:MAG: uroporphyrinogen-III synthase [Burkholderiales bacterium]